MIVSLPHLTNQVRHLSHASRVNISVCQLADGTL